MTPLALSQQHLPKIAQSVSCPVYDRQSVSHGIVHIGVGGFHRSHQAYYLHQLLSTPGNTDWAICGVGLREADRNMYQVLQKQDGLYTLVVQHPDGRKKYEVVGAITDYLLAVDDPQRVIDKMAHADTKIVSLTITEGGYNFHAATGDFNFEHPGVQAELADPASPQTVFGYLSAALKARQANGIPPFTVMSCDNIQHNGDVARKMLLAFVQKQDPQLAVWIEAQVSFPNTMVDRITPVTTREDIEELAAEAGIADEWPVVSEPYLQWVIEDNFVNGRPPLEEVGVQFVPDVGPYETMKIRLLNAGHSVLGIPGALHGHATIADCMEDEVFSSFMRKFMDVEVTPVLGPVEGIDLEAYKDSLAERFANPNIKDHVNRICSESSAKLPKFLIPTLLANLASGGSIHYATFILAAWCRYHDLQVDEQGVPLEILDVMKDALHEAASTTEQDPLSFLSLTDVFGDLASNERFIKTYQEIVRTIYQNVDIRQHMKNMVSV